MIGGCRGSRQRARIDRESRGVSAADPENGWRTVTLTRQGES